MSLRADILDALDEVITPAPMLEREVTNYVLATEWRPKVLRLRPRRTQKNFQSLAAAVAVLLVLALFAGLILGGRLFRDLHSSPTPAINQSELHKLEARPLVALPAMASDGSCPIGPVGDDFVGRPAVGNGQVRMFLATSETYTTVWGTWNFTWFVVSPAARGLHLVRARDVQSGDTVFFASNLSTAPSAQFGHAVYGGPAAGQDHVNGHPAPLRPELVLNASAPSDNVNPGKAPGWGAFVGYPATGSGCILFQVDFDGSTEKFVYRY